MAKKRAKKSVIVIKYPDGREQPVSPPKRPTLTAAQREYINRQQKKAEKFAAQQQAAVEIAAEVVTVEAAPTEPPQPAETKPAVKGASKRKPAATEKRAKRGPARKSPSVRSS